MILRRRFYILFVSRDEDGRVRKTPVPLRYAYGFVAAAIWGLHDCRPGGFLHPHAAQNRELQPGPRQERETLRKNYQQMAQIAHDRDVQVASLGALANEVTALYGLRPNRFGSSKMLVSAATAAAAPTPIVLTQSTR